MRKEFDFSESWETEIRAVWSVGDFTYYAVTIWDTVNKWIVEHKIARIKDDKVEISYREQWVSN